jgi:hypothetical protein
MNQFDELMSGVEGVTNLLAAVVEAALGGPAVPASPTASDAAGRAGTRARAGAFSPSFAGPGNGLPLAVVSDEDLCALTAAVEGAGRLLDAVRVSVAAEVADRSRHGLGVSSLAVKLGHKNGRHLIESLTRVSPAEAARRVRIGAGIRARTDLLGGDPLPPCHERVAAAMRNGQIGVESAGLILRCLDVATGTATYEAVAAAERALVDTARHSGADEVQVQAHVWQAALDPDGAEPRDTRAAKRRGFLLGAERDGLTPFSGQLLPVDAALLKDAFADADDPATQPRFLSDSDRATGTQLTVTETGESELRFTDTRTRSQRHYDVLTGLVRAGTRTTGTEPGSMRPTATVTAVITLNDLRAVIARDDDHADDGTLTATGTSAPIWPATSAVCVATADDPGTGSGAADISPGTTGIGWINGIATPVSAETIRQLVCDAGYVPILLGDNGEILHYGRTRRLFSPAQVRAMAVRDGGCVNCGAPAASCDAHHVLTWAHDNGPTSIDNGTLLCRPCHRMIHNSHHTLRMINGIPHIQAPAWLDPAHAWRRLGRNRTRMRSAPERQTA